MRLCAPFYLAVLLFQANSSFAQSVSSPLRIYGYFQNALQHWTKYNTSASHPELTRPDGQTARNSFSLQQLNLFMSKNLNNYWRAFVNFELVNSFSSQRRWGALRIEEAWVRYKPNDKFNLRLGLLIPTFNHLNEIKNRTPLLPYVFRPAFYESSFSEGFANFDEFVPNRAFVQISGVLPSGDIKVDYAIYLGNSPNINNDSDQGQTGVDTTATMMVGGRLGLRLKNWKAGFSYTRENVNLRAASYIDSSGMQRFLVDYQETPRIRLGTDLALYLHNFTFEGEWVAIKYDDNQPSQGIDKILFYVNAGLQFTERFFAYLGFWYIKSDFPFRADPATLTVSTGSEEISVPNLGVAFDVNDRIKLKAQILIPDITVTLPIQLLGDVTEKSHFKIFAIASSIFF